MRRIWSILVIIILALWIAGCSNPMGSSASSEDISEETTTPAGEEPETEEPETEEPETEEPETEEPETEEPETEEPETEEPETEEPETEEPETEEPETEEPDPTQWEYWIGDTGPAGGIIAAVDTSNSETWTYLEVAPGDIDGLVTWENAKTQATAYTAGEASDWRLPTLVELLLIYENLHVAEPSAAVLLLDAAYWSGEQFGGQDGTNRARAFDFSTGENRNLNAATLQRARAVRRF
ncbi:DUF1566 domain-containing protein [Spirochaeta africana]|uniref:DUF1566 domain-containing protein n=1 Tax=Spirochaeta africana (strain ATCC 700263 / DSM 8902 / Z-7692) TaxID=889378 RepID=H9UHE1_SPIAZ|nr:DUF1566 domain-containing protein [Spirochaeta africana]AFG36934.1 Protein of unknown function (DUF1566) [Spirochaeta africana DSM 8902]